MLDSRSRFSVPLPKSQIPMSLTLWDSTSKSAAARVYPIEWLERHPRKSLFVVPVPLFRIIFGLLLAIISFASRNYRVKLTRHTGRQ
jgi:hypothetical protein